MIIMYRSDADVSCFLLWRYMLFMRPDGRTDGCIPLRFITIYEKIFIFVGFWLGAERREGGMDIMPLVVVSLGRGFERAGEQSTRLTRRVSE